jgi:hypothetical protein
MGVPEWEVDVHLDPLPAFGGDLLGLGLQLFGDQTIEQADIFQPTAIVLLKKIAHDDAARLLIGIETNEQHALVGSAHGALRQHATDLIRLLTVRALKRFPDLLLTGVIGRHRERHELVERNAVFGINVEQLLRHGRETQPLLHHAHADEEGCGDVLFGQALIAQGLEGAELIERMQRRALDVLGQRVFLGGDVDAGIAHDARHRRGLGKTLLFDEKLERPVAPSAGRNLEHAGLHAVGVENRPDVEALQERAPGDVLGQLLDRDAGLHAPDVRLGQNKLVERDVARRRQGDLLNGSSHRDGLRDGRRKTLSRLPTRHEDRRSPLPLERCGSAEPEIRIDTNPALRDVLFTTETKAHHAASRPFAVEACASSPGRKARRKSAALLACEAARTMARLSSRSTSSNREVAIM